MVFDNGCYFIQLAVVAYRTPFLLGIPSRWILPTRPLSRLAHVGKAMLWNHWPPDCSNLVLPRPPSSKSQDEVRTAAPTSRRVEVFLCFAFSTGFRVKFHRNSEWSTRGVGATPMLILSLQELIWPRERAHVAQTIQQIVGPKLRIRRQAHFLGTEEEVRRMQHIVPCLRTCSTQQAYCQQHRRTSKAIWLPAGSVSYWTPMQLGASQHLAVSRNDWLVVLYTCWYLPLLRLLNTSKYCFRNCFEWQHSHKYCWLQ